MYLLLSHAAPQQLCPLFSAAVCMGYGVGNKNDLLFCDLMRLFPFLQHLCDGKLITCAEVR